MIYALLIFIIACLVTAIMVQRKKLKDIVGQLDFATKKWTEESELTKTLQNRLTEANRQVPPSKVIHGNTGVKPVPARTKEQSEPMKSKPNNIIVLDLEATCCWPEGQRPNDSTQEIIEIGAVRIVDGKQVGVFQSYVKPAINPTLCAECTALTGITQDQIDTAPSFPEAMSKFAAFMGENPWLISWGHYDRHQFAAECARFGIDTRWLFRHTSIKHEYMRINKTKPLGLGGAIRREKLTFDGRPHSGFDDAVNITKIFNIYADRLNYTEQKSLTKQQPTK